MQKTIALLLLSWTFMLSVAPAQERGELVSDSLIATMGYAEILEIYDIFDLTENLVPVDFPEIELHKIAYRTMSGRGDSLVLASGLVAIPSNSGTCQLPLMAYNHGTHMYTEVISGLTARREQHYIGVPFAANGYVTVLADYLGYGIMPPVHPHPFVHAKSEATVVVDALRAARELCDLKSVQLNGQLFLLGYSQGGHVTMATHKELQDFHADEFTVTASAPCSGPYDFSGIMRDSMLAGGRFSNAFFIAFVTVSYQYIYQNLYDDISEAFVAPYDSLIPLMLDPAAPQTDLRDSLPDNGLLMFQPQFLTAVLNDSLHPLNQNIRDNDLYDWAPEAPLALFYCTDDEQIPFENALFTADHMTSMGADVTAYFAGHLDHGDCTNIALLSARNWFEFYRESCLIGSVANGPDQMEEVMVYPNPNSGNFSIRIPEHLNGTIGLELTDALGNSIYWRREQATGVKREITVRLDGQAPGLYFLRISGERREEITKVMVE